MTKPTRSIGRIGGLAPFTTTNLEPDRVMLCQAGAYMLRACRASPIGAQN
jgi:hypothetical protein